MRRCRSAWRLAAWCAHTRRVRRCRLQESNKQLEKTTVELKGEKLRLDALLVRQYNLIAMLGKPRGGGGAGHNGDGNSEDGAGGQQSASQGLTLGERLNERSVGLSWRSTQVQQR